MDKHNARNGSSTLRAKHRQLPLKGTIKAQLHRCRCRVRSRLYHHNWSRGRSCQKRIDCLTYISTFWIQIRLHAQCNGERTWFVGLLGINWSTTGMECLMRCIWFLARSYARTGWSHGACGYVSKWGELQNWEISPSALRTALQMQTHIWSLQGVGMFFSAARNCHALKVWAPD